MRCPIHKEVWLYENMTETKGYCKLCDKWYKLKTLEEALIRDRAYKKLAVAIFSGKELIILFQVYTMRKTFIDEGVLRELRMVRNGREGYSETVKTLIKFYLKYNERKTYRNVWYSMPFML